MKRNLKSISGFTITLLFFLLFQVSLVCLAEDNEDFFYLEDNSFIEVEEIPDDYENIVNDKHSMEDSSIEESADDNIKVIFNENENNEGVSESEKEIQNVSDAEEDRIQAIKKAIEEYKRTILNHFLSQRGLTEKKLNELEEDLEGKYLEFDGKSQLLEELEAKIPKIKREITSLREQVIIFDEQLALSKLKIYLTEKQIEKKKETIFNVLEEIEKTGIEISDQHDKILQFIDLLYTEWTKYGSVTGKNHSTFKILLSDTTLSSISQRQIYIEALYKKGKEIFFHLDEMKEGLIDYEDVLEDKKTVFQKLQNRLKKERKYLQRQQSNKNHLLEVTQGEESEYKKLIKQYAKEQEEVMYQISSIENNIEFIKSRLEELESVSEKAEEIDTKGKNFNLLYDVDGLISDNEGSFFSVWPVPPLKGISAYFHDPTYPFGVHNAIDIPVAQGTYFYAPAAGYVYKVVDNGLGYSYLIVAHRNNILTVYGHVLEFQVKEGDLVQLGEILGKTGGRPGSKGAGWMTTGPHLHFEVLRDNKYINPFEFLPLNGFIDVEYVPKKYKMRIN